MEDLLSASDSIWWIVYRIWLVGPRNHSIHLLRSQKDCPKRLHSNWVKNRGCWYALHNMFRGTPPNQPIWSCIAESCSSKHGLRGTPPNQHICFVTFPILRPTTDEVQLLCGMAWLFYGSPTCNGWTSECLDERIPGWSWIVFLSHALEHHSRFYTKMIGVMGVCYEFLLWEVGRSAHVGQDITQISGVVAWVGSN